MKQGVILQVNLNATMYLPVSFVLIRKRKGKEGGRGEVEGERERERERTSPRDSLLLTGYIDPFVMASQ